MAGLPLYFVENCGQHDARVALVPVGDLYDEFTFGMKDPRAIRDYLRSSRARPRFVLLVGDASLDPRRCLGRGMTFGLSLGPFTR